MQKEESIKIFLEKIFSRYRGLCAIKYIHSNKIIEKRYDELEQDINILGNYFRLKKKKKNYALG